MKLLALDLICSRNHFMHHTLVPSIGDLPEKGDVFINPIAFQETGMILEPKGTSNLGFMSILLR